MPKKIDIEDLKAQLPPFVKIIESSYLGARYKARFIDLDYNQEFEAYPRAVIILQHGCRERGNKLRREATGYTGAHHKTPIEEIKAALPDYLEMDETSYKGKREKAIFRDKEFNVTFEMIVANVLRNGKGYCKERREQEFKKSVSIPIEEIENRLKELYGDKLKIIPSSYINTNSMATFEDDNGKQNRITVQNVLNGRCFERDKQAKWKNEVLTRDGNKCQVCLKQNNLIAHHVFSWADNKGERFNVNNGVTLCVEHHKEFHSQYGNGNNTPKQFIDFIKKKGEHLSMFASDIETRFNQPCDS